MAISIIQQHDYVRDQVCELHALAEQSQQLASTVRDYLLTGAGDVLELDRGTIGRRAHQDLRTADGLLGIVVDLTEKMHTALDRLEGANEQARQQCESEALGGGSAGRGPGRCSDRAVA